MAWRPAWKMAWHGMANFVAWHRMTWQIHGMASHGMAVFSHGKRDSEAWQRMANGMATHGKWHGEAWQRMTNGMTRHGYTETHGNA